MSKLVKSILLVVSVTSLLPLTNCYQEFAPSFDKEEVEGYRPIYDDTQEEIGFEESRAFGTTGKIYKYSSYILVEEINEGFHIIDNSDRSAPEHTAFFQIPLNQNIAIKGDILYADSGSDLLAMSLQDDGSFEVSRLADVFEYHEDGSRVFPPESDYYFECVDEAQGTVIGWKKEIIYQPQCYY